jgi:hypothetical protein
MNELDSLQKHLKRFEKNLYGYNYECHFLIEKICIGSNLLEARDIVNKRFKLSWQKELNIESLQYESFIEDVSEKLLYRGDKGAGIKMTPKQESDFKIRLKEFQTLVKQKFNPAKSKIYIHPELRTCIFWGFCFLIVSKERNGIYIFEGLSSD